MASSMEACTRSWAQQAMSLAECSGKIGHELQPVAARRGVKPSVGKSELLDVHHLEARVRDSRRTGELDHSFRQVDADQLPVRRDQGGDWLAQGAGAAGKVEDSHPRAEVQQLDDALPAARLFARHDAVEPLLVGGSIPAEHRGEELLRFHAFHSCSNHAAARRVSVLVTPATWMPTGRPLTGAGSTATGWCVVLKGRVKRDSGSRMSLAASMGGATTAVAGTIRASTPSIARSAWSCSRVRSSRACS